MSNTLPPGFAAIGALEIAFNRYLDFNPQAREQSAALAGKVIALSLRGTGVTIRFMPQPSSVQLTLDKEPAADAEIEAGIPDLVNMALAKNQQVAALSSGISIRGDMQIAEQFQGLLRGVDFDWEEVLAKLFGDVMAQQLGQGLRGLFGFGLRAAKSMALNSSEYLREESKDVAGPHEVDAYVKKVDVLRDDVARVEARILRMEMAKQ